MKSLKKFVTGGLVVALVSLSGSFCLHPTQAQAAAGGSTDVSASHMNKPGIEVGTHIIPGGKSAASALNTCSFDCVSTMPQVTATKKTSADSILSIFASVTQIEQSRFLELFSDPLDALGTHPPAPDILSSVSKKE